ncbi:hypothetical protein MNBD_NITROSPINAE05-370 [hydrothermal vent metagenome]|uniref:Transposase IS4-like domain-containing protein n=1 Tax=hydrothermal vent metagenome TaxID=652676 RepID=A0A3B1DUP9_9ZZZZ
MRDPEKVANLPLPDNLLLPVPDTDFRDYLDEVDELLGFAPEILAAIESDLDAHAREKKRLRMEDRKFLESHTGDLPQLDIAQRNVLAQELDLAVGRPRMSGYAVYLFLMLRGFLGSLTSKVTRRFLRESMSLHAFLQSRGLKMPAGTTLLENVNLVSLRTRELIFDKQIERVLKEELDDFQELTIDSTAVKANSAWPTDGKILTGLLNRVYSLGQKLHVFGLENFPKGWVPRQLEEMGKLEFQICLNAGKPKSRGKMKKHYRKLLNRGESAANALSRELEPLQEDVNEEALPPSRRELLKRLLKRMGEDLADARRVIEYARERVFHDQKLPSTEKVLSLSDGSAAYIKKGARQPLIGYKPQLVRSQNGFVTSLIVPEGNAADSTQLEPAIADSIQRTGVLAQQVSTDDGYASAKGRQEVLETGVKILSISGAKGKKLTALEDWESEIYREARRNRSAVESLMFSIKDGFEFGELSRRGIDAVRNELLEKVLAYNSSRAILMKKRRLEKLRQAA